MDEMGLDEISELKIIMGRLAADSTRRQETPEKWVARMKRMRDYLDSKIKAESDG